MKKHLLFLLTVILSFNSYSQIIFENGYYIDNTDQKINCLIKNIDWVDNPTEFEYKLSENSEPEMATIKSVKEFGIDNVSKYIRNTVNIDRSTENLNNLGRDKNPIFKEEQLFLKVLIDGKANLYQYEQNGLVRYFYNIENSNIEQLVYKIYRITNVKTARNQQFKQQLWNNLKCSTIKMSDVEKLKYKKSSLTNFFVQYNTCNKSNSISYEEKQKKYLFNLTLRPRFNNSSLTIQNAVSNTYDIDFGNKSGFGFGVEAEFIFPFNKNKWAIAIEPTYQKFKAEKTKNSSNVSGGTLLTKMDYVSIEVPISVRHYFFLNKNSKIFVNISYVVDLSSKTTIDFEREDGSNINSLDMKTGSNLAYGLGYKYNDRYSLEFRYQTRREILGGYSSWSSDYKTLSVIFGYSLF